MQIILTLALMVITDTIRQGCLYCLYSTHANNRFWPFKWRVKFSNWWRLSSLAIEPRNCIALAGNSWGGRKVATSYRPLDSLKSPTCVWKLLSTLTWCKLRKRMIHSRCIVQKAHSLHISSFNESSCIHTFQSKLTIIFFTLMMGYYHAERLMTLHYAP